MIEYILIVFFVLLLLSYLREGRKEGYDNSDPVTQEKYNVLAKKLDTYSSQLNYLSKDIEGLKKSMDEVKD